MTLPLMFGFTLPFLDQYFAGFYASHSAGDITRLANAKQLFSAPMSMLAQAAGVASMPFFAQLWAKEKRYEFAMGVADSVSRVIALGLLVASIMIALAQPIVGLVFGGGRFTPNDVNHTALFFALYTISLFAWSAQAIYARAFYAAGNTFIPMAAGTVVTLVSWPLYASLYHWHGAMGLAIASDFGIALQTGTIAVLLHQRRMVSLASLDYAELGRCLLAALVSGSGVWLALWGLGGLAHRLFGGYASAHLAAQIRWTDLVFLALGTLLWLALAKIILEKTGSALPRVMMKRLGLR
jgi:putative peptidoglycan lipid II flippase